MDESESQKSGSFKEKDNLTAEQKELMELRKRNKQLEMENDILKQAALILLRRKSCNESEQKNELNREFAQEQEMTAIVSDLTYVRLNQKWNYVCVYVDLFNREIIGFSTGQNKDALLVYRALASIKVDLNKIQLFHTDRGNEFKNKLIDDALKTFNIQRSLSMKGCPYDNAVAEATFKIIKTAFVKGRHFTSLEELTTELEDYIHWFNSIRIHGTLGYESPIDYKQKHLKKLSSLVLTYHYQ